MEKHKGKKSYEVRVGIKMKQAIDRQVKRFKDKEGIELTSAEASDKLVDRFIPLKQDAT